MPGTSFQQPIPARVPLRSSRLAGPAVILLSAALATAPILLHGGFCGDDFVFHVVSWFDVQRSWLHGIPYPHWMSSANYGAGEPRFMFYPPLTMMLGAALGFLLPWQLVPAALVFLFLAATGLATRALARQTLPDAPATLAGCAALFSGFTLFTAYERTAFAELSGGFWIPLLLLYALRDRHPSSALWRRALDGSTLPLALLLAGAWLSNGPLGVMASYLLAAVALAAALLARSWAPILRASIAAGLGIALAALYLVPAAFEQRWVDLRAAINYPVFNIENNWLFAHHSDPLLAPFGFFLHRASMLAASMIAVAMVGASILVFRVKYAAQRRQADPSLPLERAAEKQVLSGKKCQGTTSQAEEELISSGKKCQGTTSVVPQKKLNKGRALAPAACSLGIVPESQPFSAACEAGSPTQDRKWWILMALIPAAVLFLQFPFSLPVWNLLPMLRFLQYPWRWVLVLEAPMAIFFAAAVWPGKLARPWRHRAVAAICALIFLTLTVCAAKTFLRACQEGDTMPDLLDMDRAGGGLEGTDEYEPPGADHWKIATGLPDACLSANFDTPLGIADPSGQTPEWRAEQGSCDAIAAAQLRQPEHLRIATVAPHAGYLILRLLSYPAWRITVNGQPTGPLPSRDDGLLVVPVPQGSVYLTVDWTTTGDGFVARSLSGLALLLLIALGVLERKLSRPRLS